LRRGDLDQACGTLRWALELAETSGERLVEARALCGLSELALSGGDPAEVTAVPRLAAGG
jgi:hypothetical protein